MEGRLQHIRARAARWLPNLLVFAALGCLGWWGHAHHWTIPRFSELFAGAEAPPTLTPPQAASERRSLSLRLPVIDFGSAEAAKNCGIETSVAIERSIDEVVTANGVVGYDETRLAQLATRVPGIVWRVEKRLGDTVVAGDVLMIVDSAEVGNAKAMLLEAAVVYNSKAKLVERLEGIQGLVAGRELREAEAAREVSRAQRFNAFQKLVNLGFALRLEEIADLPTNELADQLHLLGLPPSLAAGTDSANLIPLRAPFEGVVTNCEVVRGEAVDSARPQYVIADMRRMWINLDVREEDSAKLSISTAVLFNGEGGALPVNGILTWIGTEIDPRTRMIQARAEVDNPLQLDPKNGHPGRLLRVNSFGTAQILVSKNPLTVVVPDDALHWQWELEKQVVFVPSADNRSFEPRIVRTGLVRDEQAQVLEGLKPGDRVVTTGTRILASELSAQLQKQSGDNSDAVRDFGPEHEAASSSLSME